MDKCTECQNRKIGEIPCCACGAGIMHGKWEHPCILYTCNTCGESFVGASIWYPCEEEKTEYQVEIVMPELSTRQLVFLAGRLSVPVLQMRAELEKNRTLKRVFCLRDVMELSRQLEKNDILYAVFPPIEYSIYWSCEKRKNLKH